MSIKGFLQKFKIKGAAIDSLYLSFIQVVTYLCSMVTAKLLSVALTKQEYGTYSLVFLIVSTTCSLILLGLPDCVNYFYNIRAKESKQEDRESFVNTIFAICLIIGIVVGVVLCFISDLLSVYFKNPAIKGLIWIVCLSPCFENAVRLYQTLFVSSGKARVIAIRNLIISLSKVAIVAFSLFVFKSLRLIFILNVILDFIQLIILGNIYGKIKYRVNPIKMDLKKVGVVLKYGFPMGVYAMTNTLMRSVDKFVIARLTNSETLALYTNCSKLLPLNIIVTSFATVLIPYITKYVTAKDNVNAQKLFKDYLKIGYLTIWMFSGAIIVTSKEILPFLYSDAYSEGLPIFIIYIFDGILQFASMHLIIAASGNTTYIMKLSACLLGLNFVLDIALYYILEFIGLGLLGPAIATCLVTIFYALMILRKSKRIIGASMSDLIDAKHMTLYILELLIVGVAAGFIRVLLLNCGLQRYLCMIVCCVIYCSAILVLHLKDYKILISEINQFKLGE